MSSFRVALQADVERSDTEQQSLVSAQAPARSAGRWRLAAGAMAALLACGTVAATFIPASKEGKSSSVQPCHGSSSSRGLLSCRSKLGSLDNTVMLKKKAAAALPTGEESCSSTAGNLGPCTCGSSKCSAIGQCVDGTCVEVAEAKCADENQVCDCSTYVKYGSSEEDAWSAWQEVDGSIDCDSKHFGGDVALGIPKECYCMQEPEPTPAPSEASEGNSSDAASMTATTTASASQADEGPPTPAPTPLSEIVGTPAPTNTPVPPLLTAKEICMQTCQTSCLEAACVTINAADPSNLCIEGDCSDEGECTEAQCAGGV